MTRPALPYRRPAPDVVRPHSWLLSTAHGDEVPLPDALSDWDYQMDIRIRRKIGIDIDRARREAGLPSDTALALVAVWTATGSSLRAPADRVLLMGTGSQDVELTVLLPGVELGGVVHIDTVLVLAEPRAPESFSTARRAGSILWSDSRSLRLQGDAPQFPMAVVDFAKTSYPDDAGWHLKIGDNLHAAAMGSLLLLINERNTITVTAFGNAAKPRPVDRPVLSAVYADTARIMIEHVLRNDEFTDEAEFDEDTLGFVMRSRFRQLFPGVTINEMRLRMLRSPGLFSSDIQAAVKIFEEA